VDRIAGLIGRAFLSGIGRQVARYVVAALVALLLAAWAVVSSAQTVPATLETAEPVQGEVFTQFGVQGACIAVTGTPLEKLTQHCAHSSTVDYFNQIAVTYFPPADFISAAVNVGQYTCDGTRTGGAKVSLSAYQGCGTACPDGYTLDGASCKRYSCPQGWSGPDGNNNCTNVVCDRSAGSYPKAGGGCECRPGPGECNGDVCVRQIPLTRSQWAALPTTSPDGCTSSLCQWAWIKSAWISDTSGGTAGTGFFNSYFSGASCSTPGLPIPTLPPGDEAPNPAKECAQNGGVYGSVGGVPTCLPKGSTDSTTVGQPRTSTTTTTNADGSTTTTTTTQTPTTTCVSGQCSTTTTTTTQTTTTPAGGGAGTTTNSTTTTTGGGTGAGGEGGNCDPAREQCAEGSRFGGDCAAGFVCDGDAIQCAMAKQQYVDSCRMWQGSSTAVTPAQAAADYESQADGRVVGDDRFRTTTVDQSVAFDTSERIFAGAAPLQDLQVHGVTIPFSEMNAPLSYLGYIVVAFCTLWGALILFGRPT